MELHETRVRKELALAGLPAVALFENPRSARRWCRPSRIR